MGNENLTRDEAAERSRVLSVASYDIDLDLSAPDEPQYRSQTTVRFSCSEPGSSTFIDLISDTVEKIVLNGRDLDPSQHFDGARLDLPDLAEDNELVVIAQCTYMNTGEGLHRFVDPVDNETYLYSQFEVADARRVFACFDQPDLKSTFAFTMLTPSHWTAISTAPTPTPTTVREGVSRWEFEATEVMSTYIAAVIAGPYHRVTDSLTSSDGRTVELGLLCRPSLQSNFDTEELFELTKAGFAFYEQTFAQPYPFTKYDQIFVPEFNAGAMENAGAVTYRDQYIFRSKVPDSMIERRALTVLHELAHMWFGNLVTMRWWDDLWLNESFAEWASTTAMTEATTWTHAWTTFAIEEKSWALRQDQLPSTHPVVADMVNLEAVDANFDGITYAKGASVLKHLVHYVGRDAFIAGLVKYFDKHKWGNTEYTDLFVELESASGRDLSDWTERWLRRAGVTILAPEVSVDDDGIVTSMHVVQTVPNDYPTLRPHRIAIGGYSLIDGEMKRTMRVELDVDGERTEVKELVGQPRPDMLLLNDDDFTYTKIRLDEVSQDAAINHLSSITESLPRVLVWSAAWDMTRDAEMRASDYVSLVLNNVGQETSSNTRSVILGQLTVTLNSYVHPDSRLEQRERAADALWQLCQDAEPGSDAQLLLVRAFARTILTSEQVDTCEGLYTGGISLPGLKLDHEMRWDLVKALAAIGRFDAQAIEAELDVDATATGRLSAQQAMASRPNMPFKRAAWNEIATNDALANDAQMAMIAGFMTAANPASLAPFVDAYFDTLEHVWAKRTPEMASQVTRHLYPSVHAAPNIVELTEQYMAEKPSMSQALQRILAEQADSARRALTVQQRDGA